MYLSGNMISLPSILSKKRMTLSMLYSTSHLLSMRIPMLSRLRTPFKSTPKHLLPWFLLDPKYLVVYLMDGVG